jgi:dTDP-glucose 4,6-dehydratase
MTSARRRFLVTGGAGFIGSNFVHAAMDQGRAERVVNLDKLTYAGNLANLEDLAGDGQHVFVQGDVCDRALVARLLAEHRPHFIVHLAAESHVDRSIDAPGDFVRTNVVGTFELLEGARAYLATLSDDDARAFRVLNVSTDEVFGALSAPERITEETRYAPNSPYAASKASADHLMRAYQRTYGVPVINTNCSNNFGRFQFPEKLIPLTILNALERKALPVYGDGMAVRDWLFVDDLCDGLLAVLERGCAGETYAFGGRNERTTLEVVRAICEILDEICAPSDDARPRGELVTFVADRPGHDRRYAIEPAKAERELGWRPRHSFEDALRTTVQWYVDHPAWCNAITSRYRRERLGLGPKGRGS